MEIFNVLVMSVLLVGCGLFSGFVFPCLNGPFNILKLLRDKIGKPFTCPTCSFLWTVVILGLTIQYIPTTWYMIVSCCGWGIIIMHNSNYEIYFQGMEDGN